jgi:hypothetical protein
MVQEYRTGLSATEVPRASITSEKAAVTEQKKYVGASSHGRENPYLKVQLAQIEKIEVDENGKATGRATVRMLSMIGQRTSVLMPVPASQHMFVGGLPPINTLVVIGWLPQGIGIILNYYPIKYRQLIAEDRIPDIIPGEILLQSELTEGGRQRGGATILLDRNGQVIIQDKDSKVTVTITPDGSVTIDADSKVTVNAPAVDLGGESGEELVTKTFLTSVFNSHTHAGVQSGGAVTGPPSPTASTEHTLKTKAE